MIVDAHTHFFDFQSDLDAQVRSDMARCGIDATRWQFTPEDHLTATEAADVAFVFGLQAAATGWRVPNRSVAEHVGRAPHRLVFFASVDPAQPDYMEELERCHEDLHSAGVKLGPIYQGVHPLDPRLLRDLPVLPAARIANRDPHGRHLLERRPLEFARPTHVDQVAVDFPDLKIVMAHLGHPWESETIAAIRKQPNLFADISALYYRPWRFYNSMRWLCEYGAASNVLFGSDFPATTTADSIRGVRAVNEIVGQSGLPPVPEGMIEDILHRDSLSLLGIEDPRRLRGL